jgi:hypothetical protein
MFDRLRPFFQRQPKRRPVQQPPPAPPPAANQPVAATPQPAAATTNQARPAPATAIDSGELTKRREQLSRQLTELQWDLGGLTYEMAIRDNFRLDLLARRAAALQEVDAELVSVDRLLQLGQAGAAGSCAACGALYSQGATYCWQCGKALASPTAAMPAAQPSTPNAGQPPPAQPPAA